MVDVIGPLPRSDKGFAYILTIIDRTSRYVQAVPMTEATAESCCQAFIEGWTSQFGICREAVSDNGNTFIANLWKNMHEQLGTLVSYTPVYHSASLGHLERQHRDIKASLKAALLQMGSKHGKEWPKALPWTLLGKRTAYQPDLGCTPAELLYGQPLTVPGDLAGSDLSPDSSLPQLLDKVRRNAAREPVQTSHHTTTPKDYMPKDLETASHVYVLIPPSKRGPLGPAYDGPYEVLERRGTTCVVVRVGVYVDGTPRTEMHHLENCKPMNFAGEPYTAEKPKLGRPTTK